MKHLIGFLLLVTFIACTKLPEKAADPSGLTVKTHSEPILVILEYDPWRMVIGSDSPTFVLYEDRQIIFRSETEYKSTILSETEYDRFLDELELDSRLSILENKYTLARGTDQVTTLMLFYRKDKEAFVSVYGSLRDEETRKKAPKPLLSLFDTAIEHRFQQSQTWLPKKVEVIIWPYSYAPEKSMQWPEGWPGLDDPNTVQRGDSYSIFLPSSDLNELRSLLKKKKAKSAIEIGGQKWASSLRFPFPSEEAWMHRKKQE